MGINEEVKSYQKSLIQFIKNKFFSPYQVGGKEVSRNDYAEKSNISRGTLTRFNDPDGYDVPISTIYKICKFEDIAVNVFFNEFEDKIAKNKKDKSGGKQKNRGEGKNE